MAETTLLRSSAIVQNASVGTSKPPQVNSGALPLVQVKMVPGGPQVQEGQQKPVQLLPGKDPKGAVQAGGLPMVQVKMTQNGPQLDDGQNRPVVIKDNKGTIAAGNLPLVQVKMTQAGPQVQTVPNVQGGPPHIPTAAPALSQPRVARVAAPGQTQVRRIAAPQVQPQIVHAQVTPEVVPLSIDQVLFLRHLADKYLGEQQQNGAVATDTTTADNVKLCEETIYTLDRMIAATTAQATIEATIEAPIEAPIEAAAEIAPPVVAVVVPTARPTGGYVQPAAYPARNGYVRPGMRSQNATVGSRMGNASMAPRRVARPAQGAAPLPPVIVKMDGQRAVVQNQAEVAAAKEAQAQAQAQTDEQILAQARVIAEAQAAARAQAAQADAQPIEVEATPVVTSESAPTQKPGDGQG